MLDALGLVAADHRFFHLLQVDRRRIIGGDFAQLVAGEDVNQQVALLEAVHPFLEQSRARFGRGCGPAGRGLRELRVEKAARVGGLVEIVAEAVSEAPR